MEPPSLLSYSAQDQWYWPSSDSEFYSTPFQEVASPDCGLEITSTGSPEPTTSRILVPCKLASPTRRRVGRARSRNPSKQRKRAREKEKLRMRSLTKALHHLRTYLPPCVAPAGQTLTKIETLRLAIRYIAHLSAQLVNTEENLSCPKDQACLESQAIPDLMEFYQPRSSVDLWGQSDPLQAGQYESPPMSSPATEIEYSQLSRTMPITVQEDYFNCSLDSLLESPQYPDSAQESQIYNSCLRCPQELWI